MRYTIRHITEEFCCRVCGEPCMIGDRAWEDRIRGGVFCGPRCADRHHDDREPIQEGDYRYYREPGAADR